MMKVEYTDHIFLSCHVRVSEWMHTLQLPECQGNGCVVKWLNG